MKIVLFVDVNNYTVFSLKVKLKSFLSIMFYSKTHKFQRKKTRIMWRKAIDGRMPVRSLYF